MASQGKFVWHDLMTTDRDKSVAFYTQLFGWTVTEIEMGGWKYSMIKNRGQDIGGIVPEKNLPRSHWMGYLSVDNVDAACDRMLSLGGKVGVPPTDIPNVGRFAVVTDPQGAWFSPFKPKAGQPEVPEPTGPAAPGSFTWDELLTSDPEAAAKFYQAVLGWTLAAFDMPQGKYWIFKRGDKDAAGMMKSPSEAQHPPFWLPYVAAADVDATAAKAKQLGAQLFVEPRDIPGVGRMAVLGDPVGATIALWRQANV